LAHADVLELDGRRIAEDDELVDACGERTHHRHGRRKDRVVRIELLRAEDQLHEARPSGRRPSHAACAKRTPRTPETALSGARSSSSTEMRSMPVKRNRGLPT